MNGSDILFPTITGLKKRAKIKRKRMAIKGNILSHSASLEAIANDYGFKDWNTLSATVLKRMAHCPVDEGDNVTGTYRGHRFTGIVHRIEARKFAFKNWYHLTIQLDEAIDVVEFDSFSALRQRIQCAVDETGVTAEKLSNGNPMLALELSQ